MNEICETGSCVGCFACMNACPKKAISVGYDALDKTIPVVDADMCVDCGLCKMVCPVNNKVAFYSVRECYAAWAKDDDVRKGAASGGLAAAFYKAFIEQGGVVFGCSWDEEHQLSIKSADSLDMASSYKGSKYVQAFTGFSYSEAKEILDRGIEVLYIGTPCQIAGLASFLRKPYENLYTVDIVCHGVTPKKYLDQYLNYVLKDNDYDNVEFRGIRDFEICVTKGKEMKYQKMHYLDLYYSAFLKGLSYRDNCYSCQYAQKDRISDITIGDFWGLDKKTLKEKYDGKVSSLMVNTDKGKQLLERTNRHLYFEKRDYSEAIKYNEQLNMPSCKHDDRDVFEHYYKLGFVRATKKTRIRVNVLCAYLKNTFIARYLKIILNK